MDRIKDKIAKLLRLAAGNANPNEAAAAYARAVELAARAGLNLDDAISGDGEAEPRPLTVDGIEEREIYPCRRSCAWRGRLLMGIAAANHCRVYFRGGCGLYAYGQPADLERVADLFTSIASTVDARGRGYVAAGEHRGRREGRGFRVGMADAIARRLRDSVTRQLEEARVEAYTRSGETGLARVQAVAVHVAAITAAVDTYEKRLRLRKAKARSSVDASAYAAGRAAGQAVTL